MQIPASRKRLAGILYLRFLELICNAALAVCEGDRAATDEAEFFKLVLHDLIVFMRVDFDIIRAGEAILHTDR